MFAYCNNNPINYSDTTGSFPWHVLIGAVIGGLTNALVTGVTGGSFKEILIDALWGAGVGALCAWHPELASVLLARDILSGFIECLYMGMSFESTMAYLGISLITEISIPESSSEIVDTTADIIFGTGIDLVSSSTQIALEENASNQVNQKAVSYSIYSVLSVGAGGGFNTMTNFGDVGGSALWMKP